MINCRDLEESILKVKQSGLNTIEVFSIVFALLTENVGRVALSKKLGFSERTVRKIVSLLKTSDLSQIFELLGRINVTTINAPWLSCQPVLYEGFSSEVLESISEKIILLRDFIVISSREPSKIEVLGVLRNNHLIYPGLIEDYAKPYLKLREKLPETSGLLVCWRNYKRFLDDSILLTSLSRLCEYENLVGVVREDHR